MSSTAVPAGREYMGGRDATVGPWSGFSLAADGAVRHLHQQLGLDLWLVTHVDGDRQTVVASAGPWRSLASPGMVFSWAQSFCLRMVTGGGPVAVPDVPGTSGFAQVAVGDRARVRGYVGVPLAGTEGRLFGSLCAFTADTSARAVTGALQPSQVLGRMLSTVLAGEQIAADRSHDAAHAYALAERDRLTDLRNRRGWETVLASEEQRARRYGSAVSILVVDLDDLKRTNDSRGHAAGDASLVTCAEVLRVMCRPGDAVARLGGDEFGVLAVECDIVSANALLKRLRHQLFTAGVAASVGCATRRQHEGIEVTWQRADAAMYRDKRRRTRRPAAAAAISRPAG